MNTQHSNPQAPAFAPGSSRNWQDWFSTPAGHYLLQWEQDCMDTAVADIFGYHALQLGPMQPDGLRANRMPHQWWAMDGGAGAGAHTERRIALVCESTALPFPANSIDLVVLSHTLERSSEPQATLREVHRVLVPEGRVVVAGLNPVSLWGLRQRRSLLYHRLGGGGRSFLPEGAATLGYWRLLDWLQVLGFEQEAGQFGCYGPAVDSAPWFRRLAWMDRVGSRWWPIFGAAYFLVAVKRVRGMRLLESGWSLTPARSRKAMPALSRTRDG